ncbi:hypothetical protein pb186bvf_006252 [Paramecium bursaria]
MDQQPEQQETLQTPGVLDKYQTAGKIVNSVLEKVIQNAKAGADIADLCAFGDSEIIGELQKVYNKNQVEKGIAFPTTISVNNICGHYSPLKSESSKLNQGDVAKIELGAHVDGFLAIAAHTIFIDGNAEGRNADVILAAHKAAQVLYRSLQPGAKNNDLTALIDKVALAYDVQPLEGVLSHEVKRHFIDGNKVIINKELPEQKVDEAEIQVNDVFVLDVIMTTAPDGKAKESELRTTVYKRSLDRQYQLKTKNGRAFLAEVIEKYPSFCFSLRSFEDEITAKVAVQECGKHELLNQYPILVSQGGIVAQTTFTVAVLSNSIIQIAGLPLNEENIKTEKALKDEALLALLALPMDKNSQKKRKNQFPQK